MVDREKVIKGLEDTYQQYSVVKGQGYLIDKRNGDEYAWIDPELITDALALLKRSFTPDEVYTTVIEHGQHDKRFRLGDVINYSFQEVVEILRIELMCKAGDM